MKRIIFIFFAVLVLVFSVSCSSAKDGDVESTPKAETSKQAKKETTAPDSEEETTQEETTPPETTAPETTVPETTVPAVTEPPVYYYEGSLSVTYSATSQGGTYTGLPALPSVEFIVEDPYNSRGLSSQRQAFSYGVARDGYPHSITVNNQSVFDSYGTNALAWDNKSEGKVLYLTFDCGYKYEDLTTRILNTLREKNVKAAFFCTMDYLRTDPAEVARMINDGHIVGNHSVTHPDCTTISREKLAGELLGVHNYMRVNFGYSPEYFRFPTGAYSQNALDLVNSTGYRSVFWSVAYADWDPKNQQGVESAYAQVTSRLHPGAVILLHSTSPDNAAILGRVIDYAHGQGYVFKSLDEYAYWN